LVAFLADTQKYWLQFPTVGQYTLDLMFVTFPKGNTVIFPRQSYSMAAVLHGFTTGAHQASCTMGNRSLPWGKEAEA
jgi:hypothetical protein